MRILLLAHRGHVNEFLKEKTHLIDLVENTRSFFESLYSREYNLIVISMIGYHNNVNDLVDEIRQEKAGIPIVLLTKTENFFTHLNYAKNYMLHKSFQQNAEGLSLENLSFDVNQHCFLIDGRILHLTIREFTLLEQLFFNRKSFISKERVMRLVLKDASSVQSNLPEVYLYRLRTKLRQNYAKVKIITHRYLGYQIRGL